MAALGRAVALKPTGAVTGCMVTAFDNVGVAATRAHAPVPTTLIAATLK